MATDNLTATITPRWWFKPAMYSACFIAAVTNMSDQRFEKMVKSIVTHGVKLRLITGCAASSKWANCRG